LSQTISFDYWNLQIKPTFYHLDKFMNEQIKILLVLSLALSTFTMINCEPKPEPQNSVPEEMNEEEISSAELLKQLDSQDVFIRSQATIQLGSRKEKASIPKLRSFLKDKEPGVRAGAAIALGELSDKKSTETIALLLGSDKENPKEVYLDALARMKDPSAGSHITPLLNSEDATLRLIAVDTLVQINAQSQGSAILALALKNKDREKDKNFAMAMGKLKVKSAESYLIKLTDVQDESPTLAAAYLALGRIKSYKAVEILVRALKHPYSKGKENASQALIEIGDKKAISLVFPLLAIDESETRMYVTDVLSEIPSLEAGEKALGFLNSDKKFAWGSAAKIVGRQKYKPGREKIEQMLILESTPERDLFAEALGWLGDKGSIPVLRKVLTSKSKEGRYGSAWSLGILGAKEALPDLEAALNDSDPKLVSFALEAIGAIAEVSSLATLEAFMSNRPKMAPQILSAIGQIKNDSARIVIEKYAKSNDPDVFRPALEEIAKLKNKESLPLLFEILNSDNADKRKITYYALTAITGEHFRTKSEWNNWRNKNK